MRVTQSIADRLYHKNNNMMLSNMLKNQTRIYTGKQYTRASEDAINASKAMSVRRQLRDLDMYDSNLVTAKGYYEAAETNLTTIAHDIYLNLQTKLEAACNDSYSADDRVIFAREIEEYGDFVLETLNSDYADRQIFGGSNNSTVPFTKQLVTGEDGTEHYEVFYNGVNVNTAASLEAFPGNKPVYIDVGMGIQYNDNYEVDPQTAMEISLNGAEITGFGKAVDVDGSEYNLNYVQMIYDAADALKRNDVDFANATLDRLNKANSNVLTHITTLGAKQNRVEFYTTKNEDYRYSLLERQNEVEGCDMYKEITDYESTNAAYQAILQMSSNILPRSIFDFI